MFAKVIFIITAVFLPWVGNAKIIETAHIADVIPLIDEETWFLVDLEKTLFSSKQALGRTNWIDDEVQMDVENNTSRAEMSAEILPEGLEIQKSSLVTPIEDDFVPVLIGLQNRNIVVMSLTHRHPRSAKNTFRQISSLGFDFSRTAPSKETFNVPASKNQTLYKKGILFVNESNKKGEVFLGFLAIIKQMPKKVVFIDDKRKNVEDLEEALSSYDIEYLGVHYTAFQSLGN